MTASVAFLDVGQGHAALVIGDGTAAIVDCPYRGPDVVMAALAEAEDPDVQAIFITHRDLDHCAGVPDLLDYLDVGTIYFNFAYALPADEDEKTRVKAVLSSIFSKAERDDVPIDHVYRGVGGTVGPAVWQVLAPTVYEAGRTTLTDAVNRASLVIYFSVHGRGFLIMGDADQLSIDGILTLAPDIETDVLLVSHHGALIPNTAALLEFVDPTFAIISAGRVNSYGHPHEQTLQVVAEREGCRLMCTQVSPLCEPGVVGGSPACAGSVTFDVAADGVLSVSPPEATHDATVAGWATPRCVPD